MYDFIDKYRFNCAASSLDGATAALSSPTAMLIQSYPGYANGEKNAFSTNKISPTFLWG